MNTQQVFDGGCTGKLQSPKEKYGCDPRHIQKYCHISHSMNWVFHIHVYMYNKSEHFFIYELFYKVSQTEKMSHYNIFKVIHSLLLNIPKFLFTTLYKVRRQQKNIILLKKEHMFIQPKQES